MTHLVYKLTNTVNGKAYIGITSRSLEDRWQEHQGRARQGRRDSRIHVAMRKYGEEAFTREVIATAETDAEVRDLEKKFILQFDTYANGYNCNEGGHGHLHFPEHIRRKISETQKGRIISEECKAKMSAAKRGDKRMAAHLSDHIKKGAENPRAIRFAISCPDGVLRIQSGLRAFIREHGLHYRHLKDRGYSKGYYLLDRYNPAATEAANALA